MTMRAKTTQGGRSGTAMALCVMLVLLSAAGVAALGSGCGHARTVGDPNETTAANSRPPSDKKASGEKSAGSSGGKTSSQGGGEGKGKILTGDSREGAPPLATSPGGLLKPHAVEKIQEKLAANGRLEAEHENGKLDQATREALRAFQRDHNLPATGLPDDVTVQKLGLGPGDVFRSAQDDGARK